MHLINHNVSSGHVNELCLDLDTYNLARQASCSQKDRDDGITGSKINDSIALFEMAEVGQKDRVYRISIAFSFLNNSQSFAEQGVERFVWVNREVQFSPLTVKMGYLNYHILGQTVNMGSTSMIHHLFLFVPTRTSTHYVIPSLCSES